MILKLPITKRKSDTIWSRWKKKNHEVYNELRTSCKKCGNKENLHLHHINGDKRNNKLENLQCLCKNCHNKVHRKLHIRYKEDISMYFIFALRSHHILHKKLRESKK